MTEINDIVNEIEKLKNLLKKKRIAAARGKLWGIDMLIQKYWAEQQGRKS